MRWNYYPACKERGLTLGTGPHADPTSLTILYQEDPGLDVFIVNKWMVVRPHPGALVINIGETFTERVTLAFFVNPRDDKVVSPPPDLLATQGTRLYPDFTWSNLHRSTQLQCRVYNDTLENFTKWFLSSKSLKP
ncbi:hypothetical protein Patl1_08226 [Pistacia atlantica]|uniref:Uncharacterized protein n=1 Tax=Pistacia atlantica TaxID=434234 RepID=A0ACC1AJK3_9ROSI|nr:hypothetical protein Patl1_08226 [Pistacia atlantica]